MMGWAGPALDLLKGDGSVSEAFGGCLPPQSVGNVCGTKVLFQAYNLSPSAPLVAEIHSHGTACSGVSVWMFTPEDRTNFFARFEFVHMDESMVGQTFIIQGGFTAFEMGRVKFPDCNATGAHLHESGGPEGSIVAKNSALTAPCSLGGYCSISPTGDYTNNWMHDLSWQTFPTATPAPPPTPVPGGGGGGGGGWK